MSNNVAANTHPATLAHAPRRVGVTTVRPLEAHDVDQVVTRIADRLALDARIQPLVNPTISTQLLADSLRAAADQTWIAERRCHRRTPLRRAAGERDLRQRRVDRSRRRLLRHDRHLERPLQRGRRDVDRTRGALEHYVWTIDDPPRPSPGTSWDSRACTCAGSSPSTSDGVTNLPEATRCVEAVSRHRDRGRAGRRTRRGPARRSELLDRARPLVQARETSWRPSRTPRRAPLHRRVRRDLAVAQCITFPLAAPARIVRTHHPPERGHVDAAHRHLGVGTAMVDAALADARRRRLRIRGDELARDESKGEELLASATGSSRPTCACIARSDSVSSAPLRSRSTRIGSSGVTCGANRCTEPSGEIRNFSKFHRTSPE
jgi:hypothetical protein